MGTCDVCSKDFEKLSSCGRCKSRSYCGQECQRIDWKKGHKKQCKLLAASRKNLQNKGERVKEGVHPEMGRRNVYTGKNKMRIPDNEEHQLANIRQMITQMLSSVRINHSHYSAASFAFANAMSDPIEWPTFKEHLDEMIIRTGDETLSRMMLGYREGEFVVTRAEVKYLGETVMHNRRGVLTPKNSNTTQLFFHPDLENKNIDDASYQVIAKNCHKLEDVRLPYMNIGEKSLSSIIKANPNIRNLDVCGSQYSVTDSTLRILSKTCPQLERLRFGCDNHNLSEMEISVKALKNCLRLCKKLKFVQIMGLTKCGDPTDPSGVLSKTFTQEGFTLRTVPFANGFRKDFQTSPFMFWREAIEYKTVSASWYEKRTL